MRKLWGRGRNKLSNLYLDAHDRSELVATFLAVLELAKANRVRIVGEQDNTEIELIKEKK